MSERNDLPRTPHFVLPGCTRARRHTGRSPDPAGRPRPSPPPCPASPPASSPEEEARERIAALEREARAARQRAPGAPCSSTRSACSGRTRSRTRATPPWPSRTPTSSRRGSSPTSAPRAASSPTWATGRWCVQLLDAELGATEDAARPRRPALREGHAARGAAVARGGRRRRLPPVPGARAPGRRAAHPARGHLRRAQRLRRARRGVPAAGRRAGDARRCAPTTSPPRAWCSRSASSSPTRPPRCFREAFALDRTDLLLLTALKRVAEREGRAEELLEVARRRGRGARAPRRAPPASSCARCTSGSGARRRRWPRCSPPAA